MRRLLSTAATAALLACAGHLAAQATDTAGYAPQPDRVDDYERAEQIERADDLDTEYEYDRDADLDVEGPIAPGEYELREIRDPEELERDTTGMTPKSVDDDRTEWLMEPDEAEDVEDVNDGIPDPER